MTILDPNTTVETSIATHYTGERVVEKNDEMAPALLKL